MRSANYFTPPGHAEVGEAVGPVRQEGFGPSALLLSAFDGDLMNTDVASRYRREILEPGGSRDAADLVESFLGRPYGFEAYREWLSGS